MVLVVITPKATDLKTSPTFVDTEPTEAGSSGDGYVWKYLFTVSPADVIKFDSTAVYYCPKRLAYNYFTADCCYQREW